MVTKIMNPGLLCQELRLRLLWCVAPAKVTEYIDKFRLFLNARGFAAMHQDGDNPDLIDARYAERHDTALAA